MLVLPGESASVTPCHRQISEFVAGMADRVFVNLEITCGNGREMPDFMQNSGEPAKSDWLLAQPENSAHG